VISKSFARLLNISAVGIILQLLINLCFVNTATAQLKPVGLKIGVVNSEQLYAAYPEFRKMEEQLQREAAGWQSDREAWIAKMQKSEAVITDKESALKTGTLFSDKKKAQMQAEIDSLKAGLQERYSSQMTMEQERFQKRKAELLQGVLETVNKSIEALGEAEGYDFIIDSSNGTIVYARNPDDLTDKLLRKLKEK